MTSASTENLIVVPTVTEAKELMGESFVPFNAEALKEQKPAVLEALLQDPDASVPERYNTAIALRSMEKSSALMNRLFDLVDESTASDRLGESTYDWETKKTGVLAAIALQGQITKSRPLMNRIQGWFNDLGRAHSAQEVRLSMALRGEEAFDPEEPWEKRAEDRCCRAVVALGAPRTQKAKDLLGRVIFNDSNSYALQSFALRALGGVPGESIATTMQMRLLKQTRYRSETLQKLSKEELAESSEDVSLDEYHDRMIGVAEANSTREKDEPLSLGERYLVADDLAKLKTDEVIKLQILEQLGSFNPDIKSSEAWLDAAAKAFDDARLRADLALEDFAGDSYSRFIERAKNPIYSQKEAKEAQLASSARPWLAVLQKETMEGLFVGGLNLIHEVTFDDNRIGLSIIKNIEF